MNVESNVRNLSALVNAPVAEASGTCETHGEFTSTVLVIKGVEQPAECMACLQLKIRSEREAEASRVATEAQAKGRKSRVKRIGLPPRLMPTRWDDYNPPIAKAKIALDTCKAYAADFSDVYITGANLILTGNPGNGKTHLASVLCKQVATQHEVQPLYTTLSMMLRYIRAGFGKDSQYTEEQALRRYAAADLLVIDEVGVKLSSDYEKSTLFEIIDIRYQERLPTILISNLSVGEIEAQIDARMIDRLTENATLIIFDWESYRGAGS